MDRGYSSVARRLFQDITEIDATNRRIRRPAHLKELADIGETSPETLWSGIQKLWDAHRNFLVRSSENPLDDPLVDISHESLIRQWQALGPWVDQEAEAARTYWPLDETAVRWRVGEAELLRRTERQLAWDWWEQEHPSMAWTDRYRGHFDLAQHFLQESRKAEQDESARKEARWLKEVNRNRLLARVMSALFVVSLRNRNRLVGARSG